MLYRLKQVSQDPEFFRLLITEINTNHEIRAPDGLARNVHLIRELNSNVAKVFMPGQVACILHSIALFCLPCRPISRAAVYRMHYGDLVHMQVVELYKEMSVSLEQHHTQESVAA